MTISYEGCLPECFEKALIVLFNVKCLLFEVSELLLLHGTYVL